MQKSIAHFDWGVFGVQQAVRRGDIIIVVDVLSFSTSVAIAVKNSAFIFPAKSDEDAMNLKDQFRTEISVKRNEVPSKGKFSLSPATYYEIEPETKITLLSPNGATCTRQIDNSRSVFCGALVNCSTVAEAAFNEAVKQNNNITVVACGERLKGSDDIYKIRMAVEDYLGAGAILSKIPLPKTAESIVCENAYGKLANHVPDLIWKCESGVELRAMNFGNDIHIATNLNSIPVAPIYKNGFYQDFNKVISVSSLL